MPANHEIHDKPWPSRHFLAWAWPSPNAVDWAGIIELMAEELQVNSWLVIPASELAERFSRSSGPGGQSVNTTDSRVELSFDVAGSQVLPQWARSRALERLGSRLAGGVLTVASSGERSQLMNRLEARERLAGLLREALAPPRRQRVATKPSKGARERRLQDKRRRSDTKRNRQLPPRAQD